mmetsp:Transcript_8078/g.26497  ORF Transcript_8078/g.26497 Transcript_8078/m.26497 type:complete len:222 (-) Transcript_8078:373-1038(-)
MGLGRLARLPARRRRRRPVAVCCLRVEVGHRRRREMGRRRRPTLRVLELGRRPLLLLRVGGHLAPRAELRVRGRQAVPRRRARRRQTLLRDAPRAQYPRRHGHARRLERQLPRPRRARRRALLRGPEPVSRARAAARDGVQRQGRHHRRPPVGLHHGRNRLRRTGHQRTALLLPALAHGPVRPLRLHRLHEAAPRREPRGPRRAHGQLLRAARRVGRGPHL